MSSDVVRWTKIDASIFDNNNLTKKLYRKNIMNKIKSSNKLTTSSCSSKSTNSNSFRAMHYLLPSSYMCKLIFLLFVIKLNLVLVLCDEIMDAPGARGHYTPTWAVHIEGDGEIADAVAHEHGFINLGQVCWFCFIYCIYYFYYHNFSANFVVLTIVFEC